MKKGEFGMKKRLHWRISKNERTRTVNKWDNTEAEEKISTGYEAKIGVKVKKSKSKLFPCVCRMLPDDTANCVVIVWMYKIKSSAVGKVSDK